MEWNRQNIRGLLLVVCGGAAFYAALQHLNVVARALGWLVGILAPFLLGAAIAFILNVPMRAIERHLFPNARRGAGARRPLALVLTAAFTVDVVQSVQAALDLKETLTRLAEENEELRRLAKRAEVAAAFAEDDLKRFRERTELEKRLLQSRVEAELEEQRQAREERKERRQERLETSLRRRAEVKLDILDTIADALETCRDHLTDIPDLTEEALAERRADLAEAIEKVRDRKAAIRARSARTYRRSLRILQANPTAKARQELSEALESLRKLGERK